MSLQNLSDRCASASGKTNWGNFCSLKGKIAIVLLTWCRLQIEHARKKLRGFLILTTEILGVLKRGFIDAVLNTSYIRSESIFWACGMKSELEIYEIWTHFLVYSLRAILHLVVGSGRALQVACLVIILIRSLWIWISKLLSSWLGMNVYVWVAGWMCLPPTYWRSCTASGLSFCGCILSKKHIIWGETNKLVGKKCKLPPPQTAI